MFKEQIERKRRLKHDVLERVGIDEEQALARLRHEQWQGYKTWQNKENVWKEVFSGETIAPVDWEAKLVPQPFIAPQKPESDYLLGQALLAVKMRFKPLLYFTMTVAGVFFYGFAATKYADDLWLYGIVGSISTLATLGLFGWRRVALTRAEEKVIQFRRKLENEYLKNQEQELKEHNEREQERVSKVKALLKGETDAIEKIVYDHLIDAVNWPLGVSLKLQGVTAEVLNLTLSVPGLEMINRETAVWDEAKGVVRFRAKPLDESLKDYERLVAAVVLRAGHEVFRIGPTLRQVHISVVTSKYSRAAGESYQACILSTILTKAEFQAIDFIHEEYIQALGNFKLRYAPSPQEFPGDVQSFFSFRQPSELVYLDLNGLGTEQIEEAVKDLVKDTQAAEYEWEKEPIPVHDSAEE